MLKRPAIVIFCFAILIRGFIFIQILNHPEVIFQPDSRMYVSLTEGLQENGSFSYRENADRPNVERMPGYPLFLVAVTGLFGNYLSVIILQIILDSISCVLIYFLSEKIHERSGLLSGILAALNINMISYAFFILSDSIFLFLFLVLIILMIRFLRNPSIWAGCILGLGLGITTMTRVATLYLPLFLLPFYCFSFVIRGIMSIPKAIGNSVLVGIVFLVVLSPWSLRNYYHYGKFSLTSQTGEYLLQYVLPFVWQYSEKIPVIEGMRKANNAFQEKAEMEHFDLEKATPFKIRDFQIDMSIELLKKEPKLAILKAWTLGMAKTLFAPSIVDFSYVIGVDRPHFFYTEGKNLMERASNFIKNAKGPFVFFLIVSLILIPLIRLIQLRGLVLLFREGFYKSLLLSLIMAYFLVVTGPFGYAKYRLPFEPILIILISIGLRKLYVQIKA